MNSFERMKRQNRQSRKRNKKKTRKGLAFYLIGAFILSAFFFLLSGVLLFLYYSHSLPDFKSLKERNLNAHSIVYSEEDEVVGKFLMDNRIPIPYERIPKTMIQAFLAAEDAEFFEHKGVDYRG